MQARGPPYRLTGELIHYRCALALAGERSGGQVSGIPILSGNQTAIAQADCTMSGRGDSGNPNSSREIPCEGSADRWDSHVRGIAGCRSVRRQARLTGDAILG